MEIVTITPALDADEAIRREWADSLQEHLDAYLDLATGERGMTRQQLQLRLKRAGTEVSLQSISLWLTGKNAPRPSVQIAIAKVLGVPARRLFPLEAA